MFAEAPQDGVYGSHHQLAPEHPGPSGAFSGTWFAPLCGGAGQTHAFQAWSVRFARANFPRAPLASYRLDHADVMSDADTADSHAGKV